MDVNQIESLIEEYARSPIQRMREIEIELRSERRKLAEAILRTSDEEREALYLEEHGPRFRVLRKATLQTLLLDDEEQRIADEISDRMKSEARR